MWMVDGVGMELVEDGVSNTSFDQEGLRPHVRCMKGGGGGFLIPGCETRTPEYVTAQRCTREILLASMLV